MRIVRIEELKYSSRETNGMFFIRRISKITNSWEKKLERSFKNSMKFYLLVYENKQEKFLLVTPWSKYYLILCRKYQTNCKTHKFSGKEMEYSFKNSMKLYLLIYENKQEKFLQVTPCSEYALIIIRRKHQTNCTSKTHKSTENKRNGQELNKILTTRL